MAQTVNEKLDRLVEKLPKRHSESSFLRGIVRKAVRDYRLSIEDAEDILQDKLMQVTTINPNGNNPLQRYSYDIDNTPFDKDAKFLGWFKKVYQNGCIDYARKRKNHVFLTGLRMKSFDERSEEEKDFSWNLSYDQEYNNPLNILIDRENEIELEEEIEKLPHSQNETLRLRFYEGLEYKEIAGRMNTPLGTVKTRIHYAIENLREGLSKRAA